MAQGVRVLAAIAAVGLFLLLMLLWFFVALVFRLRFQFSIRSLLVLTVAVAVPCSWLAVEMGKAREQREAVAALGEAVAYDYEVDQAGDWLLNTEPPPPLWLWNILGTDFFGDVVAVFIQDSNAADTKVENLECLPHLRSLDGCVFTDVGLEHIGRLKQLQRLSVLGTFTDAGLQHLEGLAQLQELHINCATITGRGVKKLQQALPELQDRPLTCPPPVLDALPIARNVRFTAARSSVTMSFGTVFACQDHGTRRPTPA